MIGDIKAFIKQRSPTEHTVMRNSGWLLLGEVGSRIIRGALAVVAARMLGVSGLGEWTYAIALGGFLTFFEDAGIALFVTREFAKENKDKESIFATALVLKLILLAIALVIFIFVGPVMSSIPAATAIIPVVAAVVLFDSLRAFFFSICRAEQKMHIESKVQILTNTLVVLFGIAFMLISPAPYSLALGYAIGGGIGCLAIFLSIKKYLPNIRQSFSKKLFVHIFASAWPFTILAISNIIIFSTDMLLLGHFASVTEVGLYGAASRFMQVFYILPALFATVTFPILVQKSAGTDGFRSALRKSMLLMSIIMVPLILVMTFGSHLLIRILFGTAYAGAAGILAILSLSYIPVFIGTLLNNAVFALNQQKRFIGANLAGISVNIILNLILIPRLHGIGAAISTVISLSIITAMTLVKLKRYSKQHVAT